MSRAAHETRRVVISGMGTITALGSTVGTVWRALLAGESGVRQIKQFESDHFPVNIGSEVDLDGIILDGVDPHSPSFSRSAVFGIWAMEQAWQDAGLSDEGFDPWRAGVCVGASSFPRVEDNLVVQPDYLLDGTHYHVDHYLELCRQRPELLVQRELASVSSELSRRHPLHGVSLTVQSACASATQAVGEAYQMIRTGDADLVVTGGTDSMLSPLCLTGFTLLGAASQRTSEPARASRPFDLKRDGLVMGEGAGILIVEEREHALQRGARIHAEVIGYGSSCDAYRFTDVHPGGEGARSCMAAALADAGLEPWEVDYINAHGTATPQNDRVETMAIKCVFGDHAYRVPISSTKSQLGHLICAAGGIGLIVCVLAITTGLIPPTINLDHPDPECDLDYVANRCRAADVKVALCNAFAFGGQNGTIIVRRYEG